MSGKSQNQRIKYFTETIESGTTHDAIDLCGGTLVGIRIPASMTSSSVTLQDSSSIGGTYSSVIDSSGSAISLTLTSSAGLRKFKTDDTVGVNYIKPLFSDSETDKTIEYVVVYATEGE